MLSPQRKLITELMHSTALAAGDFERAIRHITETAAQLLGVERVSVWQFRGERGIDAHLECVNLFELGAQRHTIGTSIQEKDAPRYFAALGEERTLCAHGARTDPRTSEFTSSYLEPLGITALLDAPVFVGGRLVAVVCHEHVGEPRQWQFWEELAAGSMSDFVAMLLEAQGRIAAQRALRDERDALESAVAARTAALTASEAGLRTLLAVTPIALILTTLGDDKVLFANPRAFRLFEVPDASPHGLSAREHWVDPSAHEGFIAAASQHGVEGLEAELRTHTGRVFWARISAQPMQYDGKATLLSSVDDITAHKAAEAQLRVLATRDELTGIRNRRSLTEQGQSELDRARRYGRPIAAALIDIDHFKRVNDERGHAAGDVVLRAVVEVARVALRGTDVFGRWGGEEFVAFLPETDLATACRGLERLRSAIAATSFPVDGGAPIRVTISIGVATWTGTETLDSLVQRADQACYRAKHNGRDRIETAPTE